MKHGKQLVITPVWAQKIEVEKQGNALLVTGWGHLSGHIESRAVNSEDIPRLDLLARFRRYALRQLTEKRGASEAGVYQFADADDDEKLLAFVNSFGPVWGDVRSSRDEDNGARTLIVAQDLKQLRRERELFAAAVELLTQINRNARTDLKAIVTAMARIFPPPQLPKLPRDFPRIEVETDPFEVAGLLTLISIQVLVSKEVPDEKKKDSVISYAHRVLCDLFNRHPPLLVPFQRQAIELPDIREPGIREALYFKLRLDYLAQRTVGTCLNCGGHFPVFKRGARACGETCRRALRNQKYWSEHNEKINRKRRVRRRN